MFGFVCELRLAAAGPARLLTGWRAAVPACAVAAAVAWPVAAQAADASCAPGGDRVDQAVCASHPLSDLDQRLNQVYREALKRVPSTKALRSWHQAWLSNGERQHCGGGTACLITAYQTQIERLQAVAGQGDAEAAWTGTYWRHHDGRATRGSVQIEVVGLRGRRVAMTGDALSFEARGRAGSAQAGRFQGVSAVTAGRARVDDDGCRLEASLRPDGLSVSSARRCDEAAALFAGSYRKQGGQVVQVQQVQPLQGQ